MSETTKERETHGGNGGTHPRPLRGGERETHPQPLQGGEQGREPENVIELPAPILERAVLVPLAPRDQAEADKLPVVLDELRRLAAEDSHMVLQPTHVMVKGEQIIGYLSLNGLPTIHAWFDSHHKHALDSIKMIEHGETILRHQGLRTVAVACAEQSPFTPHLARLGFHKLGTTVLWQKHL